jgi:hypothetical protein
MVAAIVLVLRIRSIGIAALQWSAQILLAKKGRTGLLCNIQFAHAGMMLLYGGILP